MMQTSTRLLMESFKQHSDSAVKKCSACSRAIIHKDVYDTVLEKVVERTKKLSVGKPEEKTTFMGPVASKSAYESILEYIEIGKKEGRLMTGGKPHENADNGFFIEPTIIADIKPDARISQEEIFGPVLAFIKADSWEHALEIANNTEFRTDRRSLHCLQRKARPGSRRFPRR